MLTICGSQNRNHHFFPGQGTKPASLQMIQNYEKSQAKKKTQKLEDQNVSPINITKRIVIQFSCILQAFLFPFYRIVLFCVPIFCPTVKPNRLFQSWPPAIGSTVDGPYSLWIDTMPTMSFETMSLLLRGTTQKYILT